MTAVKSPHTATLVADTVTPVTFTANFNAVEVLSDGSAEVWFTANGVDPAIGGDGSHFLPAGVPNFLIVQSYSNSTALIKLLSHGTPKVCVRGVDAGVRGLGAPSSVSINTEPAASTVAVDFTSSQVIAGTPKDYRGFSIRETAGAGAVVRIFDHASAASGTVLDEISLSANESAREYYGDGGSKTSNGVYAQVVSGSVAGVVRVGA